MIFTKSPKSMNIKIMLARITNPREQNKQIKY